jgi:hypothetical protein
MNDYINTLIWASHIVSFPIAAALCLIKRDWDYFFFFYSCSNVLILGNVILFVLALRELEEDEEQEGQE